MGIFKPDSKDKGKSGAAPTLRQQAMRYVERGEYARAIAAYESLLPEEVDKAAVHNIIGDLYEKMGNAEEAFGQYDRAIAEYVKEDQYRNAIGVAKKVLRYHKDRVEMYKHLADLYAQVGRVGDAIQALNQYAEQMKGAESAHIVEQIKHTIVQLREKSLLVQSAVDLGREEQVLAPAPRRPAEGLPAFDPEEQARKEEEERLVRELEDEIERELLAEVEAQPAAEASAEAPPGGQAAPAERSMEQEAAELERLVEEAIQASHEASPVQAPAEPSLPEAIAHEPDIEPPSQAETSVPPVEQEAPVAPAAEPPAEEAREVVFLEPSEVDSGSGLSESAVFAELSSKPYDSELFKSRFDQEISRSDRYGRPLSFLLMVMGFLKRNPKAKGGKKASSKVGLVRKVGDCIRSSLRDTDILAYNADGRIVLILPETTKEGALFVAQRLKGRITDLLLEQDYEDEAERLWLGILGYPKDARSKEELVRRAQRVLELGEERGYAGRIVMLPD